MSDTTQEQPGLPPFADPTRKLKQLTEDSISTEAIDFEDNTFAEENKAKVSKKRTSKKPTKTEKQEDKEDTVDAIVDEKTESTKTTEAKEDNIEFEAEGSELTEEELQYLNSEDSQDDADDNQNADPLEFMKDLSEQPFEVAMENLEVKKEDVIRAAEGVFSPKGYFEMEFDLPFNGHITLRSKSINDYIDYNEYVRRLLLENISQREFDTFTQLRNLAYAMVELDGDDFSEMPVDEKFEFLKKLSDIKVSAIIFETKNFWRVSHLMLHPGLVDFLLDSPQES